MKMVKDEKGFSLVELVIILAIMAVLGSVMFYSFTLVTGQYARECANNLSASLNKEKNYALTRSATVDCYMELVKDSDGYHAKYYVPKNAITETEWELAEEQSIGKERVGVICTLDSGSEITLASGQSVKFVYNRSSGAMKGIVSSDGATDGLPDVITQKCDSITILHGREYKIQLYPATGKHELSRVN
ncbi:MAG: type II secretion system GspH family protein [Muribaculaceae bacterium]|nr:type II secretion system GspH family protein [Muribaculaceae bacterium]